MSFKANTRRWFGYSRRERTGSLVLVIIILFVMSYRFADYHFRSGKIAGTGSQAISDAVESDTIFEEDLSGYDVPSDITTFDPNTASVEILLKNGLTGRQATTLINYRKSGGRFYKAEDFRKIYGIDRELQDILIPHIFIAPSVIRDSDNRYTGKPYRHDKDSVVSERKDNEFYYIEKIEINSADSSEFERMPGLGPVLSARIVKYRNLLGGFVTTDQLTQVYGINDSLMMQISDYVTVDQMNIRHLDLNSAEYRDLIRHPYINRAQTKSILRYREVTGEINNRGELVINNIFTVEEIERLAPYIVVADTI